MQISPLSLPTLRSTRSRTAKSSLTVHQIANSLKKDTVSFVADIDATIAISGTRPLTDFERELLVLKNQVVRRNIATLTRYTEKHCTERFTI
jgi:hypothetical protein